MTDPIDVEFRALRRSALVSLPLLVLGTVLMLPAPSEARGFLGFRFDFESRFEEPLTVLEVTAIYPGGPADRAGMKVGDIVRRMNGVAFSFGSEEQARSAFDWVEVGEAVDVTIERGQELIHLELVPTDLPAAILDHEQRAREELSFRRAVEKLRRAARHGPSRLTIERLSTDELELRLQGEVIDQRLLTLPPFEESIATGVAALVVGERATVELDVVEGRLALEVVCMPCSEAD